MIKKVIKIINIFSVCLIILSSCTSVLALGEGGTGGGAGSGGNIAGGSTSGVWLQGGKSWELNAYKFQLVYKNKNGGLEKLSTAVAQCYNKTGKAYMVDQYANSIGANVKRGENSKLSRIACQLSNGVHVDTMQNYGWFEDEQFVKDMLSDIGVDESLLSGREQDPNPGNINSYGFRFLIQKLTVFWRSDNATFVSTRKEVGTKAVADAFRIGGTSYQGDIYTTRNDIGIYAESNVEANWGNGSWSMGKFLDPNNGVGYEIIWFVNPYENPRNYNPDATCGNCGDTSGEYSQGYNDISLGSMAGLLDEDGEVSSYGTKKSWTVTPGWVWRYIQCRDEIKVKFPTVATSQILVGSGRYFTIGLEEQYYDAPNFEPVYAERTRECQAIEKEKHEVAEYDNEGNYLRTRTYYTYADVSNDINWKSFYWSGDSFYQNRESTNYSGLKKSTGAISIGYDEQTLEVQDRPYDKLADDEEYKMVGDKKRQEWQLTDNDQKLTVKNNYQLEDGLYQYVLAKNGLSVSVNDVVTGEIYKKIGVSNLPVSYENKTNGKIVKAAEVEFLYHMPTNTDLTKLTNNPNYFKDNVADYEKENIYQKAKKAGSIRDNSVVKGDLSDEDWNELVTTASCITSHCTGSGNSYTCDNNFSDCVNEKIEEGSQMKDCSDNDSDRYICPVYYKDDGKDGGSCKIENDKYYLFNEDKNKWEEVDKNTYEDVCPGGETDYYCEYSNGKLYGASGEEVDLATFQEECDSGRCKPGDPTCPDSTDPCQYGFCGAELNVIYRTIDLNNPFPGYSGTTRKTGANWCYVSLNGTLNCTGNSSNSTIYNVITKNGGISSNNPEDVYKTEPMYEITLDATKIKAIQKYNKQHEYSDFTLNCSKKDSEGNCTGYYVMNDELRNNLFDISGTCKSKSNLDSCAESR